MGSGVSRAVSQLAAWSVPRGSGQMSQPRLPGRRRYSLQRARRSAWRSEDGGGEEFVVAMRGMFTALIIMGAIWTGGLVWSVFGGLVLVPQSALSVGGARVAAPAPPQSPAQATAASALQSQNKPS